MPRRRKDTTIDDTFNLLSHAPTWLGPLLALGAYLLFRFVAPSFIPAKHGDVDPGALWRQMLPNVAWLAAGIILLLWLAAEFLKHKNRRLLDSQTGLASIKKVSWQDFEQLVAEAYRRQGYIAEVVGSSQGDGGIDIRLTCNGQKILVQCKQWRAYTVGPTIVRELLGVVESENAHRGIVVTSGRFTQQAKNFSHRNPRIELVDGPQLAALIGPLQSKPSKPQSVAHSSTRPSPSCPLCRSQMVIRTARTSQFAGSQFWGCPNYPACRGKRHITK